MEDGIEAMRREQLADELRIADIAVDERQPRIGRDFFEVDAMARVRERIEHHDLRVRAGAIEHQANRRASDEASATCDE
jgi:hypothetical protein